MAGTMPPSRSCTWSCRRSRRRKWRKERRACWQKAASASSACSCIRASRWATAPRTTARCRIYGLLAAVYGDGRPVRLAYDRFEHFQAGLKRHQFSMRYTVGVDRRTGVMQSFQAGLIANGGGRANCSVALSMVAATSAASIYYFPKTDIAVTAISSRALDCGSARGYGALETLAATEIMADEIAGELGLDPDRVSAAQCPEDRHEGRPGLGARRRAAGRDGAGEGARARAVDRPGRQEAVLRGSQSRQVLRRGLWLHPAALRRRRAMQPRQGRAGGRRAHCAQPHRHRDRHGGLVGPGRRLRALAGTAGRRAGDGRHRLARAAGRDQRQSARHGAGGTGPAGQKPALGPVLRLGLERQQLVLLLHARHAGRGARGLPPGPAAGRHGDLGARGEAARPRAGKTDH